MHEVRLPKLGMSTVEAEIVEWCVTEGDTVEIGTPLVLVATEKVETEIESETSGKVLELIVSEGDTVAAGTVLCRISDESGGGE